MAIKTRNDLMPYETGIKTELISKASKIVSNATGFPVQFNKAIVGKNACPRVWYSSGRNA